MRPARPDDKDAIVAFCQDTFDWGDYIADVWDDWLADRAGRMLVAVVEDRPVGLVHVALLDEHVAWMEGMRVHPDYRRLGIGSLLDRAARESARERGARVARLVTSIKNTAAQGVLEREGYVRVAQFNFWSAPPAKENDVRWRVATTQDLPLLFTLWSRSQERDASHGTLPTPRWTWTELTESRLQSQITKDQVRIGRDGLAIVIAEDSSEEPGTLSLHALVGNDDALTTLAHDARVEASYRGYQGAQALIAEDKRLNNALDREGFAREGAMLIYEQAL